MIPPGGASITASYATGGGLAGNVPPNTITELHSAASYVQSVTNPFPATGGSATELAPRAPDRAPSKEIATEIRKTVADVKAFASGVHAGTVRPTSEQGILKRLLPRFVPLVKLDYTCSIVQNLGFLFEPCWDLGGWE